MTETPIYRRAMRDDFPALAAFDVAVWADYDTLSAVADSEHLWRVWTEHARGIAFQI